MLNKPVQLLCQRALMCCEGDEQMCQESQEPASSCRGVRKASLLTVT